MVYEMLQVNWPTGVPGRRHLRATFAAVPRDRGTYLRLPQGFPPPYRSAL